LKIVGVPYTDAQIENAAKDLEVQTRPDGDTTGLLARYPKAVVSNFDGDPKVVTEMDALVAYLQVLGTLVDFTKYQPADFKQ
jgi:cytochrome c oxidase cbb3-type subunit II